VQEQLLQFFRDHPDTAVAATLLASIIVAILGVVPSFFITAANIIFFGFWKGTAISFGGEAAGAVISFLLYRYGFRASVSSQLSKFPRAKKLVDAEGSKAFLMIVSLRLLPFVPSGLVTFAAAVGRTSLLLFTVASSLGKIPALLMEAGSVYGVMSMGWKGKILLCVAALVIVVLAFRKRQPGQHG
jgi:uncharacterized membrane protein YdjX (TVP38/TMEM64 family)